MSAMTNWLASFVVNAAWQIVAIALIVLFSNSVVRRTIIRARPRLRYVHSIWVSALGALSSPYERTCKDKIEPGTGCI